MNRVVEQAFRLWGMPDAQCQLVAERENKVFKVLWQDRAYAYRLHRKGYRSDAELLSELKWTQQLAKCGLSVPAPVQCPLGNTLHTIDGIQVDVLDWLSGEPMGASNEPLVVEDREGTFRQIGRSMARLHNISDAWLKPADFTRCIWNRTGLLGDAPVWGRFWENPKLQNSERQLLDAFRLHSLQVLKSFEEELDFGLIHADLVRENIMLDGDKLHLIDFDDGGFGFRLFELATTLLKTQREPDYLTLQNALIEGYRSLRSINTSLLDLFIALRAATYVGWNMTRMDNDASLKRNQRFIETACQKAQEILA